MISICIPVYNRNVNNLVTALALQAKQIDVGFEIVIVDDGSDEEIEKQNSHLSGIDNVHYYRLKENKGRIQARRILAMHAKYAWLLFIDSDSEIIKTDYLKAYVEHCNEAADVSVGGRVYQQSKPSNCKKCLHWKYGRKRELNSTSRFIFMTNNFCIRKSLFLQLQFPAALKGYGHEDTWMGMQLKKMRTRIIFFDNPVLHDGLEDAQAFIEKSKVALHNLAVLKEQFQEPELKEHVRLVRFFLLQKKLGLAGFLVSIGKVLNGAVISNLKSCFPSLILFDLYRLIFFISIQKQKPDSK